jgi:hypothetical protein
MHTMHRRAVVFMRVVTCAVGACLSAGVAAQAPAQWHVPLQKEGPRSSYRSTSP